MTNQVIPAEAVEAAARIPLTIPAVRVGCQKCSYNAKYGVIACKEHRGW